MCMYVCACMFACVFACVCARACVFDTNEKQPQRLITTLTNFRFPYLRSTGRRAVLLGKVAGFVGARIGDDRVSRR